MEGGRILRPASAPKLTYRDFLRFPDDGLRHELIDGEHYVTPAPAMDHQRLVGRIYVALHLFLTEHALGEVFLSPFDVVLSVHDIVEPDLLVVMNTQQDILTRKHVRGAPAIVIEVLSPGTRRRDENVKRRLYEREGVREYWMVDPDTARIVVHSRQSDGEFAHSGIFASADRAPLTSPLLPGFALDTHALFAGVRHPCS